MTIPTRDELIERVCAAMGGASTQKRVEFVLDMQDRTVALLDAEIRRAVAEELEALRATRVLLPAINMNDPYALGRYDEELTWANAIAARLAALRASQIEASQRPEGAMREQESGYYANAGVTGPGSESVKVREHAEQPPGRSSEDYLTAAGSRYPGASRVALQTETGDAGSTPAPGATKVGEFAGIPIMADPSVKPGTIEARAGNVAAPALSDADVLERAAEILRKSDIKAAQDAATVCEFRAGGLRAASAPVPKPVDVFEAFSVAWAENGGGLKGISRDWFGGALELLDLACDSSESRLAAAAKRTRAALRQRIPENPREESEGPDLLTATEAALAKAKEKT